MPLVGTKNQNQAPFDAVGIMRVASGSLTSQAQSVAYVHQTSGNAFGLRYLARSADPINEMYFWVSAVAGTGGAPRCRIYNEQAAQGLRPGNTLRATHTAVDSVAVAGKWIKFTFGTPYTPTIGEVLWFVIDNTDGAPATNNFSLHTIIASGYNISENAVWAIPTFVSTTTGFSTNGTTATRTPWMVKQGTVCFGHPYAQLGTNPFGLNTRKKGIKFTLRSTAKLWAVQMQLSGSSAQDKVQIFSAAQLPNDTPLFEYDFDSDANQTILDFLSGSKILPSPITLIGGNTYRAVITLTTNLQLTGSMMLGDYVGGTYEAEIDQIRLEDLHRYPIGTEDSGSNTWLDFKQAIPDMRLYLSEYLPNPSFSSFAG